MEAATAVAFREGVDAEKAAAVTATAEADSAAVASEAAALGGEAMAVVA